MDRAYGNGPGQDPNAPKSTGTHFNKKTAPSINNDFTKQLEARTQAAARDAIKIVGKMFSLDPGAPPVGGIGHRETG